MNSKFKIHPVQLGLIDWANKMVTLNRPEYRPDNSIMMELVNRFLCNRMNYPKTYKFSKRICYFNPMVMNTKEGFQKTLKRTGKTFVKFLNCKTALEGFSYSESEEVVRWVLGHKNTSLQTIVNVCLSKEKKFASMAKEALEDYFKFIRNSIKITWPEWAKLPIYMFWVNREFLIKISQLEFVNDSDLDSKINTLLDENKDEKLVN